MIFATSLINAALEEQQSLKITSDPLLSRAVASEQQENSQEFQVVNITDKENVSNLDLDDGGISKLFFKSVTTSVLYNDALNEAISDSITYFHNVSTGGQHLICCSCSRSTKQIKTNSQMGSNLKRKHGKRFPRL